MKTQIFAVTHGDKKAAPGSDCLTLMAGAALQKGQISQRVLRDDEGINISEKNREYCELTAMYWVWKNTCSDIAGICHYRRYFSSIISPGSIMTNSEAEHLLAFYDAVLPKPRNYHIETGYSQYANAHHAKDLDLTREIISEMHPEYIDAFDRRMNMTSGHRFNMLIMRRPAFDRYCEWLFGIIFELEKRLDIKDYNERDRRVFGFVAERLLDVWLDKEGLRTAETDYLFVGQENLPLKAAGLILRKMKGLRAGRKQRLSADQQ